MRTIHRVTVLLSDDQSDNKELYAGLVVEAMAGGDGYLGSGEAGRFLWNLFVVRPGEFTEMMKNVAAVGVGDDDADAEPILIHVVAGMAQGRESGVAESYEAALVQLNAALRNHEAISSTLGDVEAASSGGVAEA